MTDFDYDRLERTRRAPDQQERMQRSRDHHGEHRRARPWIALAALAVIVIGFLLVLVFNPGANSDEFDGDGAPAIELDG